MKSYHDEHVRNVAAKRVQVDEIWAFTHCKQKNVATAKAAPDDAGDVWTWTAIDADSKLVLSYLVGGRDAEYANGFMLDVANRLNGRVQLTSDGLRAYLEAVEEAFGADVDYAQLVKSYGAVPDGTKGRYSPAECTGIKNPRSKASPTKRTSPRPTSSARTSRCGCTCACSPGSPARSRRRSRTTPTPWRCTS